MRRVQQLLSSEANVDPTDADQLSAQSAMAFKNKRLTFAWLDGEAQEVSFVSFGLKSILYIVLISL